MQNPTSISLYPIEFKGKNSVFGWPVAQKLIRYSRNIFAYSDGGAFNASISKNRKISSWRLLRNPDLKDAPRSSVSFSVVNVIFKRFSENLREDARIAINPVFLDHLEGV